jgi:hypothetical protein
MTPGARHAVGASLLATYVASGSFRRPDNSSRRARLPTRRLAPIPFSRRIGRCALRGRCPPAERGRAFFQMIGRQRAGGLRMLPGLSTVVPADLSRRRTPDRSSALCRGAGRARRDQGRSHMGAVSPSPGLLLVFPVFPSSASSALPFLRFRISAFPRLSRLRSFTSPNTPAGGATGCRPSSRAPRSRGRDGIRRVRGAVGRSSPPSRSGPAACR